MQVYAIRQALSKSLFAYYQKYVDEQSKQEIKYILVQFDMFAAWMRRKFVGFLFQVESLGLCWLPTPGGTSPRSLESGSAHQIPEVLPLKDGKIYPNAATLGWFLFQWISEHPILHVPKLIPLLHWFQNSFCFRSRTFPSHGGNFFGTMVDLEGENGPKKAKF